MNWKLYSLNAPDSLRKSYLEQKSQKLWRLLGSRFSTEGKYKQLSCSKWGKRWWPRQNESASKITLQMQTVMNCRRQKNQRNQTTWYLFWRVGKSVADKKVGLWGRLTIVSFQVNWPAISFTLIINFYVCVKDSPALSCLELFPSWQVCKPRSWITLISHGWITDL